MNYDSICRKLGFTMEEYDEVSKNFKDDSPSCFSVLTHEERNFLIKYCKEHNL